MGERNRLNNGRFEHDLDNWTAINAAYSAGDGDDHYGVAVLATGGGYIEQDFSVPHTRLYTLHLAVKAVGSDLSGSQATVRITDGLANTVTTKNLSGTADTWTDNDFLIGLASGATYYLRLINGSAAGDVKIDDVWLWFVPVSRYQIAAAANRKLGRVATDRSYSTSASGSQTEGDYTDAVDEALRGLGALNPVTGLPDVRYLEPAGAKGTIDATVQAMLERAAIDYAVEVDITMGPHSERLSQKREAIEKMAGMGGRDGGSGGASNQVVQRKLHHKRSDFDYS